MADLMNLFYEGINSEAQKQLANQLNGATLTPIELGSQGDFPWYWKDANGNFNLNTYNYVSLRCMPGNHGGVILPDSFVNAYDQVLQTLNWQLSQDDQDLLNKILLRAEVQANAVVSAYEQHFGNISDDMLNAAQQTLGSSTQPTKLDYVIIYSAGYYWSGRSQTKDKPLTFKVMAAARHLPDLLPDTPPSGATVVSNITSYLDVTKTIDAIQDSATNAMWIRKTLINNTENPISKALDGEVPNGGMTTTGSDGITTTHVRYDINMSPEAISNSLANDDTKLTISMTATQQSSDQLSLDISGKVGFIAPIDFIVIGVGAEASYSLFEANGSGSSASIEMSFSGLTPIPIQAGLWQQDTQTNWYYPSAIAQANVNQNTDTTGWTFSTTSPFNFNAQGDFGLISNLVISNYPTVSITYTEGNYSDFSKQFSQSSSVSIDLFGIRLIGGSNNYYTATVTSNASQGSFTLKLTPPKQITNVGILDQRTYVIGGVIQYPGADSPVTSTNLLGSSAQSIPSTIDVQLGKVTFLNQTGAGVDVFTVFNDVVQLTTIPPGRQSQSLTGTLLNIDVIRANTRYTYDLMGYEPKGLWVQDESPYQLQQILGEDGQTLLLVISDKFGDRVDEFEPKSVSQSKAGNKSALAVN